MDFGLAISTLSVGHYYFMDRCSYLGARRWLTSGGYPTRAESDLLATSIKELNDSVSNEITKVQSQLQSDLGAELPLHISLSRSMMLLTDQRQPFSDTFKSLLEEAGIRP